MIKTIYEELKSCTVRIVNKNTENKYSVKGTGFFIGKNKILTCHHVIDNDKLKVIWNDEEYDIKILEEKKDLDLVLLKVNTDNDNYVDIDWTVQPRDKCYSFGFPNNEDENEVLAKELQLNKDGMTFEIVDENDGMIKFKGEQFKEGFSGSPVLNEETGKVCSIISISRDINELKGGYGISLEKLKLLNYKKDNTIKEIIPLKNGKSLTLEFVKVELEKDKILYVGKYPITFEEYEYYCEDTKDCKKKQLDDRCFGRGKNPIINIHWDNASNYCKWLSMLSNKNYRLPYLKEWEKIAKLTFNHCKDNLDKYAWYKSKDRTIEVNAKIIKPDILGLYHFYGNINEWCINKKTVAKGGSFRNENININTKIKGMSKKKSSETIGFRIYMELK